MYKKKRLSPEKYQARMVGTILPLSVLAGVLLLAFTVGAADDEIIDGNFGVLHVHGALTESACRLDMTSVYQAVSLGDIGTGRLQAVGDQGTPVAVHLKLRDCLRLSSNSLDNNSGNMRWSSSQPAVTLSFLAPHDSHDPRLIRANGVSGLGILLSDEHMRPVRLGSRDIPVLVTPGQDTLTYYVAPVRTLASLQPGAYWANVDFRLSYD
ncbi:type 1 fimbrial protein [Serratia fonticola]|nr:type 1 fimbrial protein [Serratia fonticola]